MGKAEVGDWISVGVYVLLFIVGAPLNITAYFQLHHNNPAQTAITFTSRNEDLNILKAHLNISDILVIFGYVVSEIGWLLSWYWRGGRGLCKGIMYLRVLAFHISTNIVVAIALNRLLSILPHFNQTSPKRRAQFLVTMAWLTAAAFSSPQIFVWSVVNVPAGGGLEEEQEQQCVTIWDIERHLNLTHSSRTAGVSRQAYDVFHILTVFWIPLLIIIFCYTIIIFLIQKSANLADRAERVNYNNQTSRALSIRTSLNPATQSRDHLTYYKTGTSTAIIGNRDSHVSTAKDYRRRKGSMKMRTAKKQTLRVSAQITMAYVCCWLPYNALVLFKIFSAHQFEKLGGMTLALNALIVLNSIVNPFLYGMFQTYNPPNAT